MDRKLSDIKKLETLKMQVEAKEIQSSNIMASIILKLKLTATALLTIIVLMVMIFTLKEDWMLKLSINIFFVSMFGLCIAGIVACFNIISTFIIKIQQFRAKHVKNFLNVCNTNSIKLTSNTISNNICVGIYGRIFFYPIQAWWHYILCSIDWFNVKHNLFSHYK